jgi:hypothetical protein
MVSIGGFYLNDKVRIKENINGYKKGMTGHVQSLLINKDRDCIGVDMDGDHFNPTPHYFNSSDLEKI